VVTASGDHTARVWDADTGEALTPPLQHANAVSMASFSPDGRRVVTASADNTARVWDADTGKALTPPLQHAESVSSASFSPDGRRVVTASDDKTARVWDADTGKALTPPLQHAKSVSSASFSLDGRRVVTASGDHTARVWDVSLDERPLADIVGLAELMSAHRIDFTGAIARLPTEDLSRLWAELRSKYPSEFTVAPEAVRRWREGEIRDCMREGHLSAAEFHYWALFAELASGKAK
jgi:WD40 repeat protein